MTPDPDSPSKRCPKCAKSVSADSRFCMYCAFDFERAADPTQAIPTQELGLNPVCPTCNETVSENAIFCGSCGQTIGTHQPTSGITESKLRTRYVLLIGGLLVVVVIAVLAVLMLSRGRPNNQSSTTVQTSSEKNVSNIAEPTVRPAQPDRRTLTNANVEDAVSRLTNNLRTGGGVTVVGIQELPQENAARADIRFNGFQYKSDMAGTPLSKDKSTPKKPDVNSPNFYDEMYKYGTQQVQTKNYSGQGFAVLKHYNDGRWVLKEVHWEFNAWVGNVDIQ